MISIKDVARAAGVSPSTVSHVINKTRFVAPETKVKVEKAIDELGYQPSSLARALKIKSTRTIGMLVTSSTNPFFAEVLRGVEEGCYHNDYSLILCNSGDQHERHISYLKALIQKRIDALIVMTTLADEIFYEKLAALDSLPKVVLDSEQTGFACTIGDDSVHGGELATEFLLKRGFKQIACLTGPAGHPRSRDRLRGFHRAMNEAKVEVNSSLIIESELTAPGGYEAMSKLLQSGQQVEAVFAFNDMMAIGAYKAAQERGLAIGKHISIIGYDNLELSKYITPTLTTVNQPSYELGLKAAGLLIDHLENKSELPKVIEMEPSLIVRQSVADKFE
ncbi:substrate-binding domain-containing protein [Cohaesibacter gelatinilyticus]|uniref:Ribose operon repressor n=1 Tax=Cohaesibacter gelatinilyticus TaxID=372072 RepID=A0A285PFI4_9HYPH|nr:substrate-binding domain-containing protein [Cohaesibacter gelatinilyticus]SNZ20198.1 transcriptional regulator, LacI family [Cohaesibacter gelatinilyticus]